VLHFYYCTIHAILYRVDAYWLLRRARPRNPASTTFSRSKQNAIAALLRLPNIASVSLGAGLLDAVDTAADTAREDEIVW
jgi:hypothetical protein